MTTLSETPFAEALAAPGRASDIPESADLYGWLVGRWAFDVVYYLEDVTARGLKGEATFGWVLGGRAVQDVWRCDTLGQHGTTLRIWTPSLDAWRVLWVNPLAGRRDELIGRRSGPDIVQVGAHADGTPIRWIFTEITDRSFHWIGDALQADGTTWKREAEFLARKIPHDT